MGDIIRNISRVDQAVCWPDFTAPYSTKPSAELSSRFRLTLSCCSTTSTVDEVQWYARYAIKLVIYALVHVMLSYLLYTPPYLLHVASFPGSWGCGEKRAWYTLFFSGGIPPAPVTIPYTSWHRGLSFCDL